MLDVERGLRLDSPIGLQHASLLTCGHLSVGITCIRVSDRIWHGKFVLTNIYLGAGNVVASSVERGRLGQTRDGMLGCGVRSCVRAGSVCCDRAVVDDTTPRRRLGLEDLECFASAEEGPDEIRVHYVLEGLKREILQRRGPVADAGVLGSGINDEYLCEVQAHLR